MADKPTNERQARELAPLKGQPEVLRDVWAGVYVAAYTIATLIVALADRAGLVYRPRKD